MLCSNAVPLPCGVIKQEPHSPMLLVDVAGEPDGNLGQSELS